MAPILSPEGWNTHAPSPQLAFLFGFPSTTQKRLPPATTSQPSSPRPDGAAVSWAISRPAALATKERPCGLGILEDVRSNLVCMCACVHVCVCAKKKEEWLRRSEWTSWCNEKGASSNKHSGQHSGLSCCCLAGVRNILPFNKRQPQNVLRGPLELLGNRMSNPTINMLPKYYSEVGERGLLLLAPCGNLSMIKAAQWHAGCSTCLQIHAETSNYIYSTCGKCMSVLQNQVRARAKQNPCDSHVAMSAQPDSSYGQCMKQTLNVNDMTKLLRLKTKTPMKGCPVVQRILSERGLCFAPNVALLLSNKHNLCQPLLRSLWLPELPVLLKMELNKTLLCRGSSFWGTLAQPNLAAKPLLQLWSRHSERNPHQCHAKVIS